MTELDQFKDRVEKILLPVDIGVPAAKFYDQLDQIVSAAKEMVESVMGEDEPTNDKNPQPDNVEPWARNDLRASQRKGIK